MYCSMLKLRISIENLAFFFGKLFSFEQSLDMNVPNKQKQKRTLNFISQQSLSATCTYILGETQPVFHDVPAT